MNTDLANPNSNRRPGPPNGNRVPGYVPVLISEEMRGALHAFRERSMPVDLRIERSMVSAAVELCLNDPQLKDELIRASTAKVIEEHGTGASPARKAILPGYSSVLIRDGLKQDIRFIGTTNGISDQLYQIERVMVTEAIRLVIKAQEQHEKWVKLIATTVGWEVGNSFRLAKAE